jgi:glycosyltransferase involved in cell wall biosynthesis
MKALLIAPSLNPVTYKGLGKYCRELYERMRERVDVDLIVKSEEGDKVFSTHTEIPLRLLKAKGYDLVHALTPEMGIYAPLLFRNTVVTFHDLIPILASKEMEFKFSSLIPSYTRLTWKLSSMARRVIANSTQTKEELTKALMVKPEKIKVIPLGVDERFKPIEGFKRREVYTIGFFGNFTYRKGADIAVEAFKLIRRKVDARLILAGGRIKTIYQRHFNIREMIKGLENVKVIEYVPDEDLVKLYNSFDVMVFPSRYEGFGLPILEAQKCGVPVLTMEDAKIPWEVKKESVTCKSVEDMADKTLELLMDNHKRGEVSRKGMKYASQFTWENTVKRTMAVYNELCRRR